MSYSTKNYTDYLKKIERVSELSWVKHHQKLNNRPNFWSILEYGEDRGTQSKSAHETRSSRMIRWLMDPNETHGLGNIFAYEIMQKLELPYSYRPERNEDITATAEYYDIDIFFKDCSQNMCLAIELKQFAKEGKSTGYDSQLDKYEDIISQEIHNNINNMVPHYVFLTPLKDTPSNKNWHPFSYQELIDIIDNVIANNLTQLNGPYVNDTKKIVRDFRDDLQRSLDYLKKDNYFIASTLTDKEKKMTMSIVEAIEHGKESKHLARLNTLNTSKSLNVKELIIIMSEYLTVQQHAPHTGVRVLMRKLYNYLSDENEISIDPNSHDKIDSKATPIKQSLIDKYNLNYNRVQLTRGKGQGMYLYHRNNQQSIYLSGDTRGDFPNDGIQLLTLPNKNIIGKSKFIKPRQFNVSNESIQIDKIHYKQEEVSLEYLIEHFIMGAIKELDKLIV